jgi:hypothetical protein
MSVPLRVSLTPALHRPEAATVPFQPLLQSAGPLVVIGVTEQGNDLAVPVSPTPQTLFGPRGGCLFENGPMYVADTGHHRLLGWRQWPEADNTPADWIIGQRDFFHEGRNAKGEVTATTLNVPTGVTTCEKALAVADAWNHRVLIWHEAPRASQRPADVVLGQKDFSGAESNRGHADPTGAALFWPYGVHWDGARLWVADTGNRRVLMWNGLPGKNGQPADLVLGQPDFTSRNENGGDSPDAASTRWPHAIGVWNGRLCVADAGNNRIMVWNGIPRTNNPPCDFVLGQRDFTLVDHNQSLYWPNAASLNMPYGLAVAGRWLLIADTANSRLLGWEGDDCETGAAAKRLTGQPDFHAKGDNRWQSPVRDSLCWPYGMAACGDAGLVCDSGNNRVMLWNLAGEGRL